MPAPEGHVHCVENRDAFFADGTPEPGSLATKRTVREIEKHLVSHGTWLVWQREFYRAIYEAAADQEKPTLAGQCERSP
jgi:hypothetical protein